VGVRIDEVPDVRSEALWVGVDEVQEGSFFADATLDYVPAVALFDAVVRAATTMLGRIDSERRSSRVTSFAVEFPGLCRRGVPADLRLGFPELQPGTSSLWFEVVQGEVDVCVGRLSMSHADNDDLLAPWIVGVGKRAGHALLGKGAPWRVLIGAPRRTAEACLAVDMVGPSAPGDTGVHPASLLFEAACQVATIVTKASGKVQDNSHFIVSSIDVSLSVGEPWESYPEMICHASKVARRRVSASIDLLVDGVQRGRLLIDGRALSPALHKRVSAWLARKGLGIRLCRP
jgi:hypothetical protein